MGRSKTPESIVDLGWNYYTLWICFLLSTFGRMDDGIPKLQAKGWNFTFAVYWFRKI